MTQLYAITPPQLNLPSFLPQVEQALQTGHIACLQLRLKEVSDATVLEAAKALLPLCHAAEVPLIINDARDVAVEAGADGLHLGQEDLAGKSIEAIRQNLPESMVLGITCHASSHLAMEAAEQGADYVAFGAFYPTTSKPQGKLEKWGVPSLDLLRGWSQFSQIPCVAIGGITPQNAAPLVESGADFIAAITGIWDHPHGAAAGVQAYAETLRAAVA